jgi:hypothetical protein
MGSSAFPSIQKKMIQDTAEAPSRHRIVVEVHGYIFPAHEKARIMADEATASRQVPEKSILWAVRFEREGIPMSTKTPQINTSRTEIQKK